MTLVYVRLVLEPLNTKGDTLLKLYITHVKVRGGGGGLVDQWNLNKFNRVYTTDSYSSNVAAFQDIETISWVPCLAHVIHNVGKHGIERCPDMLALHTKMRQVLAYCHKSPVHFHLIKENTRWLGLPELNLHPTI